MNGYILMARNRGNNCNIATYAIYPILESIDNRNTTNFILTPTSLNYLNVKTLGMLRFIYQSKNTIFFFQN